jgi:hypothetical protein
MRVKAWGARAIGRGKGCLGGMGTSGLVNAFDPMADGERMLVGGFMREVVETMYARGFLGPQAVRSRLREHRTGDDRMRLGEGECFGIPYSTLVPRGWSNLWVAGRCNSSDVLVHGSIRVMPAAAMMGQAAGTAALQAIKTKRPGFSIDTEQLVTALRRQGAYLP